MLVCREPMKPMADWLRQNGYLVSYFLTFYPWLIFNSYSWSIQSMITIIEHMNVKNIRHDDSNSRPLDHESPPVPTRPELPFRLPLMQNFVPSSVTRKKCQMSIKVAQKWFQQKNARFWHLYKKCLRMLEIWAYLLLPKALKVAQSPIYRPIWSHYRGT